MTNHKQAFCLMWYACKCGHRERIWNSRNGVTPFSCGCPSCGDGMTHVEWGKDECRPDHVLHIGQKFWRDGTTDEAEAIMRRRIDKYKGTKYEPSVGGEDSEFRPGWPMLDIKGHDA